uniref:MAM domain-containing protein n=1 Tax=Rhabditophanes sp. KR3021 TaxID=114890 RepID=A0AC35U6F5_9BILA
MIVKVLFLFVNILLLTYANSDLNCDFQSPCCWKEPTPNSAINDMLSSDIIDINWYRRTFRVGKSRPPPAKNYLLRTISKNSTSIVVYESCGFCSESGVVNVEFRHWQSPATKFYVCYKQLNKHIEKENCELVDYILQSKLIDIEFEIPKNEKIQLLFMVSNPSIHYDATAMIDRVNVRSEYCGLNIRSLASKTNNFSNIKKIPVANVNDQLLNSREQKVSLIKNIPFAVTPFQDTIPIVKPVSVAHKELLQPSIFMTTIMPKLINNSATTLKKNSVTAKSTPTLEEFLKSYTPLPSTVFTLPQVATFTPPQVHLPPITTPLPKLIPTVNANRLPSLFNPLQPVIPEFTGFSVTPSNVTRNLNTPNANKQVVLNQAQISSNEKKNDDPLVNMLGKDFADFLDPAFETSEDEATLTDTTKNTKPILQDANQRQRANGALISKQTEHHEKVASYDIFGNIVKECSTIGGCLFEKSTCGFRNNRELSTNGDFKIAKVGESRFVEARLSSGQIAVLETHTDMKEDHYVVFDVLEWIEGEKLSACCVTPGRLPNELICPYETPIFLGAIEWKSASIMCPAGTTKIMFICENYGKEKGLCALDNIRLHKTTDSAWLEPCQKRDLQLM